MLLQKVRRWALISSAIFVSAYGLLLANPMVANADGQDGSFISSQQSGKVLDHQLYYFLYSCFASSDLDKITYDELKEWRWFEGRMTTATRGDMYEQGSAKCEGQWLSEAFGRFGFTNPVQAFCALDFAYSRDTGGLGKTVNGGDTSAACESGADKKSDFDAAGSEAAQAAALDKLLATSDNYGEAKAALSQAAEYVRYYRTFMRGCDVTLSQPYTEGAGGNSTDNLYQVTVVNQDGSTEDWLGTGHEGDTVVDLVATRSGETGERTTTKTCAQLVEGLRGYSAAYANYMEREGADDSAVDQGGGSGSDEAVCSAGALGWVFCPLTEFISDATQSVGSILEERLIFPRLIDDSQGSSGYAIRTIWGSVLGIANVGLVIAFLIIIFSQATSVGISSYGIKKMLPKVVAAAILMNLSYFICAIAVDLANILGISIKAIVEAGLNTLPNTSGTTGAGYSWSSSLVAILGVGLAVITGAIAFLLPVLATALIAVLTAFLVIAARDVIVTLLIIVAPLAFLAWILPNTEQWFTKWRKLFTTMLMMFPLVMLVFYGSILMSNIILKTAGGGAGGEPDLMTNVIALAVLTVPLFSLPFIMKSAGGALDRLGIMVNNRNKGLVDRSRKYAKERYDRGDYSQGRMWRKQAKSDFRQQQRAKRLGVANSARTLEEHLTNVRKQNGGAPLTAAQVSKASAEWSNARKTRRVAGGTALMRSDLVDRATRMQPKLDAAGNPVLDAAGNPVLENQHAITAAMLGNKSDQRIVASGMVRAQSSMLERTAQAQAAKAFSERKSAIITSYDNGGSAGADTSAGGYLEQQFIEGLRTGNHEQVDAVITRLSSLGAGGRNRAATILKAQTVTDPKMQDTIIKSVMQDNYGALVGSRADTAKANGFDTTGKWDSSGALGKLGTGQLATQDEKTLYQNFADISQAEATKIMSEPNLESTVQNAKARAILKLRQTGATSLPTSGPIDPSDPTLGNWSDLAT